MNETCTCYSLKTKLVLPVEDRIERWEEIGSAMVGRPAAGRTKAPVLAALLGRRVGVGPLLCANGRESCRRPRDRAAERDYSPALHHWQPSNLNFVYRTM
jgi:hypothetical protein